MRNRILRLLNRIEDLSNSTSLKQKVVLVAVTKTFSADKILEAYNCGLRIFGENRIQEALIKIDQLKEYKDIKWHMIGHLQSNKVKKTKIFSLIHSIDSIRLLEEIASFEENNKPEVLIQINSSLESTKSGLNFNQVDPFFEEILEKKINEKVKIRGLMTIGPLTEDRNRIREAFKNTRKIYEELQIKYKLDFDTLSMGMSGDYDIAIQEGSTMVRIGSLIFGERNYV